MEPKQLEERKKLLRPDFGRERNLNASDQFETRKGQEKWRNKSDEPGIRSTTVAKTEEDIPKPQK